MAAKVAGGNTKRPVRSRKATVAAPAWGRMTVMRSVAGFGNTDRLGRALVARVADTTLKVAALVAVPPGVVTVTKPLTLPVPPGTTRVMLVADTTVKLVTAKLPMFTAVAPVKLVPVMVTAVPGPPVVGVKLAIVGTAAVTTNVKPVEVPPPGAGLVTVTAKLPAMATAVAGTMAVTWVAETNVVAKAAPLKLATEPLTRFVPFMVMVKSALPATTVAGVTPVIVGTKLGTSTVKAVALVAVPVGVVMAMAPEVAPAGTVKVRVVAFTTAKPVMAAPFRLTAVAPVKSVPVTVTSVPTSPLAGVKLAIVGAGTGAVTVKTAAAEVPPPGAGLVTVTS